MEVLRGVIKFVAITFETISIKIHKIGIPRVNTHDKSPMFCHNSTIHSATKFQSYHLVYGSFIVIPLSLTHGPEPQS